MIDLFNIDCVQAMRGMKDKAFDLAIVDPPYGIGYENGGQYFDSARYEKKKWDTTPSSEYFEQLRRVSKNQIIWGGNYFEMPPSRCFVVWYKSDEVKGRTFSECEYAWTSFATPARHFELKPFQRNGERIHPTQKPVKLYEWLLKNYAKPGDTILDTHLGSGSIALACDIMGFDLVGFEIDTEYFYAAKKRLEEHKRQGKLVLDI